MGIINWHWQFFPPFKVRSLGRETWITVYQCLFGPYYGGDRDLDIVSGRTYGDHHTVWRWPGDGSSSTVLLSAVQVSTDVNTSSSEPPTDANTSTVEPVEKALVSCMNVILDISVVNSSRLNVLKEGSTESKSEDTYHNGDYRNHQEYEVRCGTTTSSTSSVRQRQSMPGSITSSVWWKKYPVNFPYLSQIDRRYLS